MEQKSLKPMETSLMKKRELILKVKEKNRVLVSNITFVTALQRQLLLKSMEAASASMTEDVSDLGKAEPKAWGITGWWL